MHTITLSTGTVVDTTGPDYITFTGGCFTLRGQTANSPGVTILDKIGAAKAILDFYRNALRLDLTFRAQKRGKGEWRYWTGTHWGLYPDFALANDIVTLLDGRIDDKQTTSLLNMLADRTQLDYYRFDKTEVIAFDNCALYREGQQINTKPHDRLDYSTFRVRLPVGKADCPEWLRLVARTLPEPADRAALQELFGYCLFPSYQGQAMFILSGPPATGKGTLMEVLSRMIGPERVTGVRMETLGETHGLAPLKGAYVNFDPETQYLAKEGENILKFITGGGSVTINEKYEKQVTTPLTVRMVMSCNTLPKFNDKTDALWQRIVVIPFENEIPAEERVELVTLLKKVEPEMQGIVWWALKGLRRVLANGRTRSAAFTQSARAREILEQHRKASDHFLDWYEIFVEPDQEAAVLKHSEVYQHYCTWSRRNNYAPVSRDPFITAMGRKGHPYGRPGGRSTTRAEGYKGLRLRSLDSE